MQLFIHKKDVIFVKIETLDVRYINAGEFSFFFVEEKLTYSGSSSLIGFSRSLDPILERAERI